MGKYRVAGLRDVEGAIGQVRSLVEDAEALLRNTAGHAGGELEAARARLRDQLDRAQDLFQDRRFRPPVSNLIVSRSLTACRMS